MGRSTRTGRRPQRPPPAALTYRVLPVFLAFGGALIF